MIIPLYIFEWLGTFLALFGAFIMASKKVKPIYPYSIWILSNIIYIYFFSKTGNDGLMFMSILGIFINIMGFHQWKQDVHNVKKHITSILIWITIFFFSISLVNLFIFIFNNNLSNLEWMGSSLGIGAAFLLSSRHKYSFLCWFFWTAANAILAYVGFKNNQFGFMFLQFGFMVSNFYGLIVWLKESQKKHSMLPADEPTHI